MIAPIDFLRLVSELPNTDKVLLSGRLQGASQPIEPNQNPEHYQTRSPEEDLLPWADPYIASLISAGRQAEQVAAEAVFAESADPFAIAGDLGQTNSSNSSFSGAAVVSVEPALPHFSSFD